MARLKDRNKFIPNGFRYIVPETGWTAPLHSSFDALVKALIQHRRGNPHLARKHNWSLDYNVVANQVDEYNAAICVAHNWNDFILNEASFPKLTPPRPNIGSASAGAVAAVKRTVAGVKVVSDWLGSGLRPVSQERAEKRASICVKCPLNQDPNWLQKLDAIAAKQVKTLVEVKNDLTLKTSLDDKLLSCQACDCYLPTKVWIELQHVLKNTSAEARARLDPFCWIISEAQ